VRDDELVKIWPALLAPIIGLVGTLLGVWIGHRRWRYEQANRERRKLREEQQATYLELWDVVETCHVEMRNADGFDDPRTFSGFIADVNNFMIRRGLFIEAEDRNLVLEYLFWTYEFIRRAAETLEGRAALEVTAMYPSEFPSRIEMLGEVRDRAEQLRDKLRNRVRQVLGAGDTTPFPKGEPPSAGLSAKLRQLSEEVARRQREAVERQFTSPPDRTLPILDDHGCDER